MSISSTIRPHVVVIGDVNVDVVIAPVGPRGESKRNWTRQPQYREFRRAGGAWLVDEIVRGALGEGCRVSGYSRTRAEEFTTQVLVPPCPTSVALVKRYSRVTANPDDNSAGRNVYRLQTGGALGWYRYHVDGSFDCESTHNNTLVELLNSCTSNVDPPAELIVIHDHNNGFRDLSVEESLARFTKTNERFEAGNSGHPGIIVWHTDGPVAEGPLWNHLHEHHLHQLVAVVNVEDLRAVGVNIREDLSLEQTASNFLEELQRDPLSRLRGCAFLAVRFTNGVLVYSPRGTLERDEEFLFLAYLPGGKRFSASRTGTDGFMVGYTLLTVGALVRGIEWAMAEATGRPEVKWSTLLTDGIRMGAELGACYAQLHYRDGFMSEDFETDQPEPNPYTALLKQWANRAMDTAYKDELTVASILFNVADLRAQPNWSRVALFGTPSDVSAAAMNIVRLGLDAVVRDKTRTLTSGSESPNWRPPNRVRCPYFKIGDLKLIDRSEIDDIESIATLLANYLRNETVKKPLSIAVFGPPGSGKSFSVKQVLKAGGRREKAIEFNMAQFSSVKDLATAFHQVQDYALAGIVPLVIFDEFDSALEGQELGWLKYLLAPMQDGTYRDGETTDRVGRAILVFAGGTHNSFGSFYHPDKMADKDFRDAKGPDFVSRLRGHLNISGINTDKAVDEVLMLRRAILLRSFLEQHWRNIINPATREANVDDGVLNAFLRTCSYEHGVRSMEAVVQMATVSEARHSFQKASIPIEPQLAMHVNAREFLEFVEAGRHL
jgi:hypothetical protein